MKIRELLKIHKLPVPAVVGSGKDFRQKPGTNIRALANPANWWDQEKIFALRMVSSVLVNGNSEPSVLVKIVNFSDRPVLTR
jgi:hypothetical protein